MSNRMLIKRIILVIFLSIPSSCAPEKLTQPLTQEIIQNFLIEKEITPVVVEQRSQTTLIIYEQDGNLGYYEIGEDKSGEFVIVGSLGSSTTKYGVSPPASENPPKIADVIGRNSGEAFLAVVFQDQQIAPQIRSIKVIFQDGQEVVVDVQNEQGIIIHNSLIPLGWKSILFYSETGDEIGKIQY